jgi:mannose-6-phosphate isomerase-like protein (cupin superfamily)
MRTFDLHSLLIESKNGTKPWSEFLRAASLSLGIYHLKAGAPDKQQPHGEDEVYYVIAGKARFCCGDQQLQVGPGTLIFVERLADHRFFDIAEDLTVLVFFAPPEGSQAKS